MSRYEQLKKDLLQNFKDFQNIKYPGGSDEANAVVAEGLAESIAKEIDRGLNVEFRGEYLVEDINRDNRQPGFIYTTKNAGRLVGDPPVEVVYGTVVFWNGEKFKIILRLAATDYGQIIRDFLARFRVDPYLSGISQNPVQNRIVTTALNSEITARTDADRILQEEIDGLGNIYETKDDAKAKARAWGVGMRYQNYQTLKFFRPEI